MDQTAVWYYMTPKTTIHQVGERTISICTTPNACKRVTVAVTITALGKNYQPSMLHLAIIPSRKKPGWMSV